MVKRIFYKLIIITGILLLFVGCGDSKPGTMPGAEGSSGTEGTSGAEGSSGTEGTTGAAGSSGPEVASGAAGSSGTEAAFGVTGSSGTEGTTGETGPSGTVPTDNMQGAGVLAEADGQYIGDEEAKQIALGHAGLAEDEVRFEKAHLESDHGSWKYDVEFYKDGTEYDYDIDALTGEILSFDKDMEYDRHGYHGSEGSAGDKQVTEDQAKQIALEYAGVNEGDVQRLKIELDYDHGHGEYEVEWHVGSVEYSCDVDADTGEILSFEEDYTDGR